MRMNWPETTYDLLAPGADLDAGLVALDTLNSWARSDSYRRMYYYGPRNAVYWMKNSALRLAFRLGMAEWRPIRVEVECRQCHGTGDYDDSMGYHWHHCRACDSTGRVSLRFLETTIGGRFRWHTPSMRVPWEVSDRISPPNPDNLPRLRYWWEDAQPVDDWTPNQPGKDLTIEEHAELLCIAETTFIDRPRTSYRVRGWDDDARVDAPFNYRLYVGELPRVCFRCGSQDVPVGGCRTSRCTISWNVHACKACEADLGSAIWDAFPYPDALLAPPSIQRWREMHLYSGRAHGDFVPV